MQIFAALKEDAQQGWVWLQDPSLPPRCVVRITNPENHQSIYCEALQIDANFINEYNQSPKHVAIVNPKESLVINAWYRAGLGGISTQMTLPLEISAANTWRGKFCACVGHPQIIVRLAALLGGVGFLFGVLSFALELLSLC